MMKIIFATILLINMVFANNTYICRANISGDVFKYKVTSEYYDPSAAESNLKKQLEAEGKYVKWVECSYKFQ